MLLPFLCILLCSFVVCLATTLPPSNLRVNRRIEPTIDVTTPTFSWTLSASTRGTTQRAFQLEILDETSTLVYDTGTVYSNVSAITVTDVVWKPNQLYKWRVRWLPSGETATVSPWSTASRFLFGLVMPADWKNASWITGSLQLRNEFRYSSCCGVRRATLYLACIGWCEARFNGKKLGDNAVLEPGWTQWNKRLEYVTYDIDPRDVLVGANVLGLWLGNGWPGHLGLQPAVKVLLSLRNDHNNTTTYVTSSLSSGWKTCAGPITSNDIYVGESYDARLETPGWDAPGFDASDWSFVVAPTKNGVTKDAEITAQINEPIRALQLLPARTIEFVSDEFVVDCGQNIAGWTRITIPSDCSAGTVITLRHAEYLSADGTLYVGNLRTANATDTYVCSGGNADTIAYEPRFTYHGFRYVGIRGWPDTAGPSVDQVACRVVHSGVEETGIMAVGDGSRGLQGWKLINQIQSNVRWGQLDNLHSIPTDCPQRDERQGWMGDASVSCEQAMHNFGMGPFYAKWLLDMMDAQSTPASQFNDCSPKNPIYPDCDGSVTDTTPHVPGLFGDRPADPSWGAALPIVSYLHWRYYFQGDKHSVRRHYDAIKSYVDWLGRVAAANETKLVLFHWYGDWLEPQKVPSDEPVSEMMSAFNFAFAIQIAHDMAEWLGRDRDAFELSKRFDAAALAFNANFFNSSIGLYGSGSQAEQVPALFLRIAPNSSVDKAVADALVKDIVMTRDSHLNTGMITTKWLFPVLSRIGRPDVGLALLLQRTDPSWGFMVANNATTVWEHWNAYHNPTGDAMSSHNHPGFTSIGSWLYQAVVGIKLDDTAGKAFQPAFRRIIFAPELIDYPPLSSARATVQSPAGDVSLSWELGSGGNTAVGLTQDDIGAGWRLVRRVAPGSTWHPAVDHLNGTSVYNDGRGTFSRKFRDDDFDQFLFATGDFQKWLIVDRREIQWRAGDKESERAILRSSIRPTQYTAKWRHRSTSTFSTRHPWISLVDHEEAIVRGDVVYVEDSYDQEHAKKVLPIHDGASVYIRKSANVALCVNVTVPVGSTAELRLPPFAAVTAANMVVTEGIKRTIVWLKGSFIEGASSGISGGFVDAAGSVRFELGSGSFSFEAIASSSQADFAQIALE